jgi:hypothetical protein
MKVAHFVRKYTTNKTKGGPVLKDRIDSTKKWVEYAADIVTMTELLKTATIEEKFKLTDAMQVADRKKTWHYKQDNFDLRLASFLFQTFLNAKKI